MTIQEAITRFDALIYNTYSESEKRSWLSTVDKRVYTQVMQTHEGCPEVQSIDYEAASGDRELILPGSFDHMYLAYMGAMAHLYNGEIEKYNNSMLLFQADWDAFVNWYNRNFMPLGCQWKYR